MTSVISLRGITKDYQIGEYHGQGLWQGLGRLAHGLRRDPRQTHRALDGVDLEVDEGEILGIIGANGSGKSTLLKILARVTDPTAGTGTVVGRVAPLLEVGTGFNPELTGKENVIINGSLLGMTRAEIDAQFDNIVEFAGVREYIDTPVKRYSSGMKVRLGFAVAAHLQPEILLVDEVLAVGDAEFQRKCLNKVGEISTTGRTVLFVSHQMEMITNVCSRVIWLERGQIRADGNSHEIVRQYLEEGATRGIADHPESRSGKGNIRVTNAWFEGHGCNARNACYAGEDVDFIVEWVGDGGTYELDCRLYLDSPHAGKVAFFSNELTGKTLRARGRSGRLSCQIKALNLAPGEYYLTIEIVEFGKHIDFIRSALKLIVLPSDFFESGKEYRPGMVALFRHSWNIECRGGTSDKNHVDAKAE